jgi:hypothetical protein
MKPSTRRTLSVSAILLISILILNCSFQSMATPYPYEVNAPEALSGIGYYGGTSRWADIGTVKILDGHTSLFYVTSTVAWIATGNYTGHNPWQWPALPDMPNNATILNVELVVVLKYPYTYSSSWFYLQYAVNTTYDEVWSDTASWYGPGNATWIDGPITYWKTCKVNVTDETVGGPIGGWSASMINSNETWVRIYTGSYLPYNRAIEIDYIGLNYIWEYPIGVPAPPSSGSPIGWGSSWITNIFIATLGGVGFIGMIAYPGIAIYSYKSKDEKLGSVVGFIIGETLFIGLLWFALSVFTGRI